MLTVIIQFVLSSPALVGLVLVGLVGFVRLVACFLANSF